MQKTNVAARNLKEVLSHNVDNYYYMYLAYHNVYYTYVTHV